MKTYISLLRGINVGGHKKIKMADLRALYEALGFVDVESYIQSGNVVFRAREATPRIQRMIEEGIRRKYGFDVDVMVRTASDFNKVIAENPWPKEAAADSSKVHVMFLSTVAPFQTMKEGADVAKAAGHEIFFHCPNGLGRSKLPNLVLKKLGAISGTMRNWRTIMKLMDMASS